jgi:hypothetical protein
VKAIGANVLARFFIDHPDDTEAVKQRSFAVAALSKRALLVKDVSVTPQVELLA